MHTRAAGCLSIVLGLFVLAAVASAFEFGWLVGSAVLVTAFALLASGLYNFVLGGGWSFGPEIGRTRAQRDRRNTHIVTTVVSGSVAVVFVFGLGMLLLGRAILPKPPAAAVTPQPSKYPGFTPAPAVPSAPAAPGLPSHPLPSVISATPSIPAAPPGVVPGGPIERFEQPDPMLVVPSPSVYQIRFTRPDGRAYLAEQREFGWKFGAHGWRLGKKGELGDMRRFGSKVVVRGRTPSLALSTHPPDNGYTRVCYALNGRAAEVRGAVALSEDDRAAAPPTRFLILGDGQVLWRSEPVREKGQVEEFAVKLPGVRVLELRVYAETPTAEGAHAVWVDPYLTPP